jgi:hypothetical protein
MLWGGVALAEGIAGTPVSLRSMQEWTVVVSNDAIPSERYAADEFCRLFKAITGSELPTKTSPGAKGAIFIGESSAMHAHPLGFSVATLGEEGLRIRTAREAVVIAGGRPRGTLYGVYEFFERYQGVRFLTKDDTYIPPGAAESVIPLVDYQYVPPFSFRWSYYQENFKDPAFATRLRVNTITADERLGGKTSQTLINHTISNYVSVAVYGHDHPEYFALVDGVRKLDARGGGPQVCSLDPDVIKIVSDGVERELNADPSLKNISVSQMDNNLFCECTDCSALRAREETAMAPHLVLVNAVAERIAKTHPGVKVGTLVYAYTRKPPKTIKVLPNVEIMLCSIECCTLHPLDDPDCIRNRRFCEDFAGWRNICQNIWIWHYNTNFNDYALPFPNFNAIAKNVQFFRNNHVRGVFMQAAGNGLSSEMSDLRNYVMARCLWRPTEERWALVDEFCRLHYGAAAPPILAYLRFLHQNAEARGVHPDCSPVATEVGLDADVAQRIHAYFQEALKLAPDATIRQRVEKATIPALRALLATTPLVYDHGLYRLDPEALAADTVEDFVVLTKKYGMNMFSEWLPVEQYIEELRELRKGLPAVALENQVWRVVLLPEQNGRLVELTYKRTGRNLVSPPRSGFTSTGLVEQWPMDTDAAFPGETSFSSETKPGSVVMTKTLPDGSVWRRTVSLPSDSAGTIKFQTEFTAGESHAGWVVRELPGRYSISGSEDDPNVLAIYAKDTVWREADLAWQTTNRAWQVVQVEPPLGPDTTAFAYYDQTEHSGVQQTFAPGTFARPQILWNLEHMQIGLEMLTPVTPMKKGQKLSFGYEISYLEKSPMDQP